MRQNLSGNDLARKLVIISDFVIINIILLCYILLTPDFVPGYFHSATKITILTANFAMAIGQYFFQTKIHYRKISFEEISTRVAKLVLTHVASMVILLSFLSDTPTYFQFAIIYGISTYITIMLARFFERKLLRHFRQLGRNTRSVIMIGNDPALVNMYNTMIGDPTTGYRVKGYYSNKIITNNPQNLNYLGDMKALYHNMENNPDTSIDDVFCSLSHDHNDEIAQIMKFCDAHLIRFYYIPRMFGNYRLRLKPEMMGETLTYTNHLEPLSCTTNKLIKRLFDVTTSIFCCICLIPIIPIIALIIKIQSPGPIFFKQERTGFEGKTFNCYKFRSMHVNKDADTAQATKNDPRKFAFGNFMRKTNVDELPQFWNVLKGDMSIVGPRPHMLHHTQIYSELIDKYMVRHFCKPGITGWAQVTGFRGETKELWQMEERVERDIWYIEHWTFMLDIKIIYKTIKSVIIPDKCAY
ncbi:undecaprenyl-phosphate glucose phosphotransferase [Prevotella sp.]|uniref:undecaprenyl-phosphate glucose phosphotransferase n=1 Tax=Prevotella sp. TaxID=59823 RepID=UPI002647BDB5|nr:undecaprenyl-phosphate glucose phosphotransferase [Prevotella sp.]MDN5554368.1 undecaprenyl-phosphate glucose phosphotransferase [Prevotella sp.]